MSDDNERVIGTPDQDSTVFPGQQQYQDTCAIRCQEFLIEMFTGVDIPEDALVREAQMNGWYTPGNGTNLQDVGNLLDLHGIPNHRVEDATMLNLAAELAQGHKVIVGVESDDLWRQSPIMTSIIDTLGLGQADHAVVVSGIDTSNPDDVRIIISDPGTGQAAASYSMSDFLSAWEGSHFYMVSTNEPAPDWMPEMAHFDYTSGHLDYLGDYSWNEHLADHVFHEDTQFDYTDTEYTDSQACDGQIHFDNGIIIDDDSNQIEDGSDYAEDDYDSSSDCGVF